MVRLSQLGMTGLQENDMANDIPTYKDVKAARQRLFNVCYNTPLLRSAKLEVLTGATVWLKAETLQHTGSFKFRGAANRIAALTVEEKARGVVAFSSGNHAQGVARAARKAGIAATIVMPSDAPAMKVARTRADGAQIILYDRATENREVIAAQLAVKNGSIIIPSFDDGFVIAGQGTAGIEIAEALETLDMFLCCCGGGGLASGCTLALREKFPKVAIITVEPEYYDDVARSLVAGERLGIDGFAPTLCDALQTPKVGELTFGLLQAAGATGVYVTDAEVKAAMRFAFGELKLVVEPGGCVALAALLAGKIDVRGKAVAVMLSGGNVDAETFAACLA
jgi:threonine dehydratase